MTKNKNFLNILIASFIIITAIATPVGAISDSTQTNNDNSQSKQISNQPEDAGTKRLDKAKLQICEAKEAKIKKMISNTNQLGQGQLNLFDNIAKKVKTFYEEKNLKIDNYDELVSQMEGYRQLANNAIQSTIATSSQFGCNTEDPKGTANQYKLSVQAQIKELKDYRSSIKNLVTSIQNSLTSQETSEE